MANAIDLIRNFYPDVPFHKLLGIEIVETPPDSATVRLPFRPELAGGGDAFHGGVIGSLVDLTGALAAWSGHDDAKGMRASTVMMSVQYLSAAQGESVVAIGRVLRRGKELTFCEVDIQSVSAKPIAKGSMVYRIV